MALDVKDNQSLRLKTSIFTPLGQNGAGGIDRVMDSLRQVAPGNPNIAATFVTTRGARFWQSPVYMLAAIVRLVAQRLSGKIDVAHINVASRSSTARKALIASTCRLLSIPYVIHLHGAQFHKFWPALPPIARRRVDAMFRHAGAVIVLGKVWKDLIVDRVPEAEPRIFIVKNASAPTAQALGPIDRVPAMLFLGRVGDRKGAFDLIEALGLLPRDRPWRAVIAGDGELTRARERAAALGLNDRIEFPGWVGPQKVAELLQRSTVLVLPSYDENLPMSVIEGFAAGLAVVATPVGATPDILRHEETGLLVTPGDTPALAESLWRLIEDQPLRERLGENARRFHAEHLNLSKYTERLAEVWQFAATR